MAREPDFGRLLSVLKRTGRPDYLPRYEHIASPGFISAQLGRDITKARGRDYWKLYVEFWLSLGFDCIPLEISMDFGPTPEKSPDVFQSEGGARISSREDFERFSWPDESRPIDFEPFEIVAKLIPDTVKIVAGPSGGPFERSTQQLFGVMGLSYMLADDPALVAAAFDILGKLYVSATRQLASMEAVGACRQGDDLGFKTSTFLPPEVLREHVFPIYRGMAAEAHAFSKPFVLHSCGNLSEVYEDIIDCGVDAKHSFEDQILPVAEFQQRYGDRITPLGGLDVDVICRADEKSLRAYTRRIVEQCWNAGPWALGTGNSLTDYMPVEKYRIVLDEADQVVAGN